MSLYSRVVEAKEGGAAASKKLSGTWGHPRKHGKRAASKKRRQQGKAVREESLEEYGGIGGRIAGARKPIRLPVSPTISARDMTPELIEKRRRELKQRQEVRERLRQLAIEERRPLKTLGEAAGGIKVGSRFKFPNEVGKLAHSAWEIDSLGGPGGKVILYRVGKGGKTMSAMQPGKNLTGVPSERFRKMLRSGDAVIV